MRVHDSFAHLGLGLALFAGLSVACGGDGGGGNIEANNGATSNSTTGGTTGGGTTGGGALLAPTVDPLPMLTDKANLEVTGGRPDTSQATEIVVSIDGADAVVVAPSGADAAWSGSVALAEGPNSLTFWSRSGALESPKTEPFVVTLDTTPPDPPKLDTTPECVPEGDDAITLEGSVDPGDDLQIADADNVDVDVQEDGTFTATVGLEPGENSFDLTAVDAAGNVSDPLTVTLRRGAADLTLNDITSPTDQPQQELSGTRGAGTGVFISDDGETWEELVAVGDETEWSATIPLEEGTNTIYLRAEDADGNTSCATIGPVTIEGEASPVCTPVVDGGQFGSPTNATEIQVVGSKCAGVGVWVRFEGEEPGDLEADAEKVQPNGEDGFSFSMTLEEGAHTFYIHTRDEAGRFSAPAGPFFVEVDLTAPEPPAYACVESTSEGQVVLEGTKEAFSNLCLRRSGEDSCTQVRPLDAGTDFSLTFALQMGENLACLSSRDAAGNLSAEACCTIERVEEQVVEVAFITPLDGSAIGDGDLDVTVMATDDAGISGVEICIEGDCGAATDDGEDLYSRTVSLPGGLENGDLVTLSATATSNNDDTGDATVGVLYLIGGLPLSETIAGASSERAEVAVDGAGNVHVVWSDECSQFPECPVMTDNNLPYDVFHRVWVRGEGWSAITNLSLNQGDGDSRDPDVAIDSLGNLHVVWSDNGDLLNSDSDADIVHTSYDAITGAWTATELVSVGSEDEDTNPTLATGPNLSVVAVWQRLNVQNDSGVYLSRLNRDGTWTAEVHISVEPAGGNSRNAAVVMDAMGDAHVLWQHRAPGGDWDIYHRELTPAPANDLLGDPLLISDDPVDAVSLLPSVAIDVDGLLHVVWQDTGAILSSGTDTDVFYRTLDPGGDGLGPIRLVTDDPMDGFSEEPTLILGPGGAPIIAWLDTGDIGDSGADPDLYMRTFGDTPGPIVLLTDDETTGEWPSLAIDPETGSLHVVWEDEVTPGGAREINYLNVEIE